MRVCDNCGTMGAGSFCERCGKPFPPPVPGEVAQEQVEFEPPARVQYSAPPRSSWEPSYEMQQGTRYRGATEVRFRPAAHRTAVGANVLGFLSLIFALLGGVMGIVFGLLAIHMGRKANKEGLKYAEAAITLGMVGTVLSIFFTALFVWVIFS